MPAMGAACRTKQFAAKDFLLNSCIQNQIIDGRNHKDQAKDKSWKKRKVAAYNYRQDKFDPSIKKKRRCLALGGESSGCGQRNLFAPTQLIAPRSLFDSRRKSQIYESFKTTLISTMTNLIFSPGDGKRGSLKKGKKEKIQGFSRHETSCSNYGRRDEFHKLNRYIKVRGN